MQEQYHTGVIMITHDLGVVAQNGRQGDGHVRRRTLEDGPVDEVYYNPHNPYTWGLLGSLPRLDETEKQRLTPIEGQPPNLLLLPAGCPFSGRCPYEMPVCAGEFPALEMVGPGHGVHCWIPVAQREKIRAGLPPVPATGGLVSLLEVSDLKKHFPIKSGVVKRTTGHVYAVDGVSFAIEEGKTLGLVGESGCGKSTTGRCFCVCCRPPAGASPSTDSTSMAAPRAALQRLRRDMQIVFQDPYALSEPAPDGEEHHRRAATHPRHRHRSRAQARVFELLETVGLTAESRRTLPARVLGGQRQRIGVARALALNPRLIICDEPVSALDVSIQAQMINLLEDLQKQLKLTYLFIAHDLSVVKHISIAWP